MKVVHNRKTFCVRLRDLKAGAMFRETPGGHVMMVCTDGRLRTESGPSWLRVVDLETGEFREESCGDWLLVEPVEATLVEGYEEPEP